MLSSARKEEYSARTVDGNDEKCLLYLFKTYHMVHYLLNIILADYFNKHFSLRVF